MHWSFSNLELVCFPPVPGHVSQPWDSADEYLIDALDASKHTLIINDRHGALATTHLNADLWHESACARHAIERNLSNNALPTTRHWVTAVDRTVHQVAIRIPKDFDQLVYWLSICQQQASNSTTIYLAGMAKHIPVKWLNWLEQHCDDYTQAPIRKKARLISLKHLNIPERKAYEGYSLDGLRLESLPGVFSRNQPDIGGRFLLESIERQQITLSGRVCDLGCGNGLLGLTLKRTHPDLHMTLTDDALSAVMSARHNAHLNQSDVSVLHGDTLDTAQGKFDTIVCNPPFHDGHKQLTNLAERMFEQSCQRLTPTGQLLVVANRHLPYKPILKRLFKVVDAVGNNSKFLIYACRYRR